jgi:hypothetical protein
MKKLPELNVSFEEFYRIFFEPVRAKIMMTGLELKVFNYLSEPVSAKAVASAIYSLSPGGWKRQWRIWPD